MTAIGLNIENGKNSLVGLKFLVIITVSEHREWWQEIFLARIRLWAARATIGTWGDPSPCKRVVGVRGNASSTYYTHVTKIYFTRLSNHVFNLFSFDRLFCSVDVWFHPASEYYRHACGESIRNFCVCPEVWGTWE